MTLSELLLLIIVVGGAAYVGFLFGRWSVLNEQRRGDLSETTQDPGPLPGPRDDMEEPRRGTPPPASAGGGYAEAGTAPRRSTPPPASAGAGPGGPAPSNMPRRTAKPPPARAGLLDPGDDKPSRKKP